VTGVPLRSAIPGRVVAVGFAAVVVVAPVVACTPTDAVTSIETETDTGAGGRNDSDGAPASAPPVDRVPPTTDAPSTAPSSAPTLAGSPLPLDTLPPVDRRSYPNERDAVVFRISVRANGIPVPLLTVYGDRTAVSATDDGWRVGTVTDVELQQFLAEADAVGLLDELLSLRDERTDDPPPLITVDVAVDGATTRHEFDLGPIERTAALRAFLQRAATSNPFALTEPLTIAEWISCSPLVADGPPDCQVSTEPLTPDDRPVLRDDPPAAALLAELTAVPG
jgi:hypothetical protein